MKKIIFFISILICFFSYANHGTTEKKISSSPKKIILMIGDGMGLDYVSLYRYYKSYPTGVVNYTEFDKIFFGTIKVNSYDNIFTDSAAAATAMATGVKTINRKVGVDHLDRPVTSLIEIAKTKKYLTGVITDTSTLDATPAGFLSHVKHRKRFSEIAQQYYDNPFYHKPVFDLLFGSGRSVFENNTGLLDAFDKLGYHILFSFNELHKVKELPVLGLFFDEDFPFAIDNEGEKNKLLKMTQKGLSLLNESDQPFLLVVEASRIDKCGHKNDVSCMLKEMEEFEKTIAFVKSFVDDNPDSILIATADHSTGGVSLGNPSYIWKPEYINKVNISAYKLAKKMIQQARLDDDMIELLWDAHIGFSLQTEEISELRNVIAKSIHQDDDKIVIHYISALINQYAMVNWSSHNHSSIDVPLLVYPSSLVKSQEKVFDNTFIFDLIHSFL